MMYKKVLIGVLFAVIVGGTLAFSSPTDAEVLTKVGRTASEQVIAALPDRSQVAGPLAHLQMGDLTAVDDRVRVRLKTDAGVDATNLTVTADGSTVKLSGKVATTAQRERAVQLAQTTAGVTKVEQEIAVPEGK